LKKHTDKYDLYNWVNDYINFDNKKILDFGGSFGNLIASSNGNILQDNYTCLDVDKIALHEGKTNFPSAKWIWYNRYNTMYNPNGTQEWPKLEKYDIIFSYSIFSHSSYEDLISTVGYLKTLLNKDGKIYISYPSQSNKKLVSWLMEKRIRDYGSCDSIVPNNSYIYLAENKVVNTVPHSSDHFFTLYNDNYISTLGEVIYVDTILQNFLKITT
jgi:2-polyprenyl-3-methyl-5-hydroxy-6-metoxy-1,4-benzoquinol methylase